MKPLEDSGIYEAFIPGLGTGELYKFAITTKDDKILFKADPYAFSAEFRARNRLHHHRYLRLFLER